MQMIASSSRLCRSSKSGRRFHLIAEIAILYVSLIILFVGLEWLAYSVPHSWFAQNAVHSAEQISGEDHKRGFALYRVDGFTDCLMVSMSVTSYDQESSINNAMRNPLCYERDKTVEAVTKMAGGDYSGRDISDYGRYWHGYQLPLRLMLCAGSIEFIHVVNYIVLIGLFIAACWLIVRRRGWIAGLLFAVVLVLLGLPIIPKCMQFSSCFYIFLIAIIVMLGAERQFSCFRNQVLAFFAIGAVTSFLDLLTAPLVTLCFPLAIILYSKTRDTKLRSCVLLSCSWGAGYALTWASKWVLATLITGMDILTDAFVNAGVRINGALNQSWMLEMFVAKWFMPVFATLFILFLLICYMAGGRKFTKRNAYLLLIALMPVGWYLVLQNHSIIHFWFVWRSLGATLFCSLLYLCQILSGRSSVIFKNLRYECQS